MQPDDDLPGGAEASPSFDRDRARRAARSPDRPGERCAAPERRWVPRVDRRRCEGKAACVAVCPYGVFEVTAITDADYRALPALTRLKLRLHGKKTAYTPHADRCRACGLCVVACPEDAITLGRG